MFTTLKCLKKPLEEHIGNANLVINDSPRSHHNQSQKVSHRAKITMFFSGLNSRICTPIYSYLCNIYNNICMCLYTYQSFY